MKPSLLNPFHHLAVIGFLLVSSLCGAAQGTARINGRVVHFDTGTPIENARVTLDVSPGDDRPEFETTTDVFGFFEITGIAPGDYQFKAAHPRFVTHEERVTITGASFTNRVGRLRPIDGQVFFDIYFQVWCLSTHASLLGANIRADYWRPDGDVGGAPDQVFNIKAGAAGDATFVGMQDGFYSFTVNRTGWEPLTYEPPPGGGFVTVGNKVRLIRYHYGSVFLRPIKQDLAITVKGYDPVKDLPDQPLKGMTIKVAGVDLSDDKLEITPTQNALSAEDGTFTFNNLAPIRWKVTVGRLGYAPKEVLVTPDANGALPAQTINVELEPVQTLVTVSSPYQTSDAVAGARIQLQGIRNSNTEGIEREILAEKDAAGPAASALFEHLLPGRYWIRVKHEATLTGLPSRSGPLFGPGSFQVSFFPKETFAELTSGMTEVVDVKIEPVPAKVRGRIWVTDDLANADTFQFDPEPNRIFHLQSQRGITFLEHELMHLLPDTNNVVVVDSDAAGNYTALLPPGIFGVQIPTMTTYTGHNIEYGDLTAGQPPRAGPWPYPDIWPYPTFEGGHHGAGLRFDSGHDYQLDLFMHAHYVNLCGNLRFTGAPFGNLVLTISADGERVQTIPYDHLQDVGAEVVASGPTTIRSRLVNRFGFSGYLLKRAVPGTYVLSLDSPDYAAPPKSVTIAPWQPPGVLPIVAPFSPTYFFPGITHCDADFDLAADWRAKGSISINRHTWFRGSDDVPPGYFLDGTSAPRYFRMTGLPDRLFEYRAFDGGIPSPSYTVWLQHGNGWFSTGGSGSATFDAYEDGPKDNTPPNQPPAELPAYTLDLRACSMADPALEIPNVTVQFGPTDAPRAAGGQMAHDGSPYATGATQSQGQWVFARSETKVLNAATRLIQVKVFMNRAMVVSGKISSPDGPVPGAAVVLRNRYGNPIAQVVTRADGAYSFPFIPPQTVYLDVNRRGFIPQRHRYNPPSVSSPDINADISLKIVPPPTIDQFTMNRFGMFLPGVSKSGDSTGFNPENAREKLTATWVSVARGADFNVTLDGYFTAEEKQGPPETFDVVDPVVEMWLVDRRGFTNAFVNQLDQTSFQSVAPPAPLNYVNLQGWIGDIYRGQKSGQPYHVVHQMTRRGQNGPGNRFQGRLNLWELPSGEFRPRIIAITESGGVAFKDYDLPAGKISLQGMNLPQWASSILEIIGVGANFGKFTDDIHAHYGEGYLKIGTISPVAEGRIDLDPLDAKEADDAYLAYKYTLGVELPLGEGTSKTGPLNLGPEFLGFKAQGAKAEFEVKGKEKKAGLAISVSGTAPPSKVEERDSSYLPVVTKEAKQVEVDAKLKYTAKAGVTETLDADWLGNNHLSEFGFFLQGQGTVDIAVRANATPVLRFIPYAGPVLVTLDKSGAMTVRGVFETTLGSKLKVELTTRFPKPGTGGTQVRDAETPHFNPVGGTEVKKDIKIIVRIAAGLQISAWRGAIEGTGLIQVGAPADAPSTEGIFITVNPTTEGPIFTKIEGALSAVLRAGVNLWTVKFQKQWQWDIAKFVIDRKSEPSFELVPVNITYTIINAASAPQQEFIGKGGILVDQFYGVGSFNVTASGTPFLVFTGTDPATGRMTVMISLQTGEQWSAPIQIGASAGVISVAVAKVPAGGWLVVWSQISDADVGNPYPSSALKYALSDNEGKNWSPSEALVTAPEAMFDIKLATTGNQVVLAYLATSEGPMGGTQSLHSAVWDGTRWTPPAERLAPRTIKSFDLAGSTADTALAVVATGANELVSLFWDGKNWAPAESFATKAGSSLSLKYRSGQEAALAWLNDSDGIAFSTFDVPTRKWTHHGVPIDAAVTDECALLPLTVNGETLNLVVWTQGGDTTSLWSAFLDSKGAPRADRTEITLDTAGTFRNLQLRHLPNGRASVVARYTTPTSNSIREFPVGLPKPGDCDGDGVPDDVELASGTARDCNRNGIPDDCEIRSGVSPDRNHNGIPDECETTSFDCNQNGIDDLFELAVGLNDENANGVLDECEKPGGTKTVSLSRGAGTRFFRATRITVVNIGVDSLELKYEGTLEQSDSVSGPWSPVP